MQVILNMKRLKSALILFCLLFTMKAFAVDFTKLPPPYNTLTALLPFDGHGWYVNSKQVEQLIHERSVRTVIEVGSWLGLSTRHIARLLPEGGKVYAVDHWLGSSEHKTTPEFARYIPTLYEQFLSNVVHTRLTNKIVPVRMESLDAAKALSDVQVDMIYLDSGHETENVYNDLVAWFPYVMNKKGVFCGDDWCWPSVRAAVEQFAQAFNLEIQVSNNFWVLQEK